MRVLAITKIFPSAVDPTAGPYNRQQFAALTRHCQVDVLATIPYFPGASALGRLTASARLTGVPWRETIDGLAVVHPRTLYVPRVGHGIAAELYTASLLPLLLARRGRYDVVLGAWAHPDGVAAVMIGRLLGIPTVVKLHGSDVNVVSRLPGPRRAMSRWLPRAARIVAVSRALGDSVAELGVARERIDVIMNGVDAELFHPRPRAEARRELGLAPDARWLVYVGRLQREKGVLDLLDAFRRLAQQRADVHLALVGDGPAAEECRAAAASLGARVVMPGMRPLAEVPVWIAAGDALVLPSWNEGTPNVLLEAMACGRRVIATTVGGCPDVVSSPELGHLVPPRDPAALARAMAEALETRYDPARIAALGARGGWAESAARLHETLRRAMDSKP